MTRLETDALKTDSFSLKFKAPIPFFVGENGSGKSTMMAGIAELREVTYEETEHYKITKAFMGNPDRFLKELMSD